MLDLQGVARTEGRGAWPRDGPGRILFGSDSGMLPRGYRYDIVDNQLKLAQEMRVPIPDIKKMFYDNMAGLADT